VGGGVGGGGGKSAIAINVCNSNISSFNDFIINDFGYYFILNPCS